MRRWTADEDAEVIRRREAGDTNAAIGADLGRGRANVQRRATLLGLTRSFGRKVLWTDADREVIRECRARGVPLAEIAERLDRSYEALKQYCHSTGLSERAAPSRRWTAEEDKALLRLATTGSTNPEIAAKLDRTVSSVSHRLSRRWWSRIGNAPTERAADRPTPTARDLLEVVRIESVM